MSEQSDDTRLETVVAVSAIADRSLSVEETIGSVLDLVVPELADICIVDGPTRAGTLRRLGVRALGPNAQEIERQLGSRAVTALEAPTATGTIASGETRLQPLTDEDLVAAARDDTDLAFLRSLGPRASLVAPLVARRRTIGAISLILTDPDRAFGSSDGLFLEVLAGRIALALDNANLRAELGEAGDQVGAILAGLADAVTVQNESGRLLYANQAAADLLGFASAGDLLAAGTEAVAGRFAAFHEDGRPVSSEELPGRAIFAGKDPAPLLVRAVSRTTAREHWAVTKAAPVRDAAGRVTMAVNVMEDVTEQKRAELRARLLADAGDLFGSSLDYAETLRQVARLAVPGLADLCAFEILDGAEGAARLTLAHADPSKVELAERIREHYARDPVSDIAAGGALRSGRAVLHQELSDEPPARDAADAEQLALLRQIGMDGVIIAPVRAGPELLGTLTLGAEKPGRRFNAADLELATELGRRAGAAIVNAKLFAERSYIASTLQRSLLPERLPAVPGWELDSLYRAAGAANDVGGDFYDVFEAGGNWYAVIGDVAGKGAEAAALTSLARYVLRTALSLTGDMGAALAELDNQLRQRGGLALCTAACVRLHEDAVAVVCAGHPLPLLIRDGKARPVGQHARLLGVGARRRWDEVVVRVCPGDALVLYTDGVLDTVGEHERFGEERLERLLSIDVASAGQVVATIDRALSDFQRGEQRDDTAVLLARSFATRSAG